MKFCILGCILSLYIGLEHFFRESVQNTNETMIGQQYVSSAFPDIGMTSFLFMKADHRSGLLKNAFILTGMTSSFFFRECFELFFSSTYPFYIHLPGKWKELFLYILVLGIGVSLGCWWMQKCYQLSRTNFAKGFSGRTLRQEQSRPEHSSEFTDPLEEIKVLLLPKGMSRLRTNVSYEWLVQLEEELSSHKKLRSAKRQQLQQALRVSFTEVMDAFGKEFGRLTPEDQLYCLLILLDCSLSTIEQVTGSTYEALKTRKSRLKSKIAPDCFESLFSRSYGQKIKRLE